MPSKLFDVCLHFYYEVGMTSITFPGNSGEDAVELLLLRRFNSRGLTWGYPSMFFSVGWTNEVQDPMSGMTFQAYITPVLPGFWGTNHHTCHVFRIEIRFVNQNSDRIHEEARKPMAEVRKAAHRKVHLSR